MQSEATESTWDFGPAISLLNALSLSKLKLDPNPPADNRLSLSDDTRTELPNDESGLGDFGDLWNYLGRSRHVENTPLSAFTGDDTYSKDTGVTAHVHGWTDTYDAPMGELEAGPGAKGVKWRDEIDGGDIEDNIEPASIDSTASLRTQKRAARRAKARAKAASLATTNTLTSDTGTDAESAEELERLRRSPDRRSIIQHILGRPKPVVADLGSPPTSPSPPKAEARLGRKEWPIANPFTWQVADLRSPYQRITITPRDSLTPRARKAALIALLLKQHPQEKRYLCNAGLMEPAFLPLNVSDVGVHVFIDISNIMIGFHDCLKVARDLGRETRVRRVPLCFHNFALVLERGRPAAKRVLVGSDRFAAIEQAAAAGYETNILERVLKAKELTPRQKKFRPAGAGSGLETSGSDTNATTAVFASGPARMTEQAVDEILHLKILESLIDAERPSTVVLATGDAAEAEYSGGFMRMVQRALEKGWMVELVSFRLNTSSAYKRREFRAQWGPMFKWIPLDEYVEMLIDVEE